MEKQEDIFSAEFREHGINIFDRRFPAMFDDPIYDPTKMTIIQGTDGVLDDLFSYQVYNKIKNHWRAGAVPADIQAGMIWSDSDDDKLYHHGAADEEILQLTRSDDVTPTFLGLLLAEYITHVGDADTYIRFQPDQITLRAGGIDFLNMVEAGTDYLQLLTGKNFIGDNLNANMTIGLTINQGANDDEIFAFKSSDVAHGITVYAETDTYGYFKKDNDDTGALHIRGLGEAERALSIGGFYTTDNTTKSAAGRAPTEIIVLKKDGADYGDMGADANALAVRVTKNAGIETIWILDEDGDTWQPGEITCAALTPLLLGAPTELTIAGGVITVAGRSYYTVDGQGDLADDLNTINGGVDGMFLMLGCEAAARAITIKHNVDNIRVQGGADLVLDLITKKALCFYDGTSSIWLILPFYTG